ncbi:SANT/Myb_domain [Hexamita inflata]|uniref:SANT/Myb domain n=1 Tax=Hexamita inflata TaxID=28002 RepID=A0AA86TKM6_9EUKA|nr:SANT/Myb domain [Hexamita inflata]
MQATQLLIENCELLQDIHRHLHCIDEQKNYQRRYHHQKWTSEEDQLMDVAILLFGQNYRAISKVVASKSSAQVYQRLRYLRDREYKLQYDC